jgi:hypothetical protein
MKKFIFSSPYNISINKPNPSVPIAVWRKYGILLGDRIESLPTGKESGFNKESEAGIDKE